MQRTAILLAYFFVQITIGNTDCFAQSTGSGGQYPFVRYTPKDGLISNQIRNIYQDSKGRLYFSSANGLSIYDGARFINYTSKNGLNFDFVNCVMEMGDDSIWIVTNSGRINCLVKGKMKTLVIKDMNMVINNLVRTEKGDLYAASEQGLYVFEKEHFTKLPFTDTDGKDINYYLNYLTPAGDFLLVQRDYSLIPGSKSPLYLYNTVTRKITAQAPFIYNVNRAPDGRIWVSTEKKIMAFDTIELKKGNIVLEELPEKFSQLKDLGKYFVLFDKENNCWLGNQSNILIKADPNGTLTTLSQNSGLSMFYINSILEDREGITWIATNNDGVSKLVHNNFSLFETPFNISPPFNDIFYNENKDQLLFLARLSSLVVLVKDDKPVYYKVPDAAELNKIIETPYGIFGIMAKSIIKMTPRNGAFYQETIFTDTSDNFYSNPVIDKNGNFIVCGKSYVTAVLNGKTISKKSQDYYADYAAVDSKGMIWVANRAIDLIGYQTHPDDPSNYLEQKFSFKKELTGISPRSFVIDRYDNMWIGTRNHGINVFYNDNGKLIKKFVLTTASGLSDDFTTHLTCDGDNNIWACSALGLDRITVKNGFPVIENLTRQNNIYQSVFKVAITRDNIAWGTVSNGLIRITPEKRQPIDYSPSLMLSLIKAGKDTIAVTGKTTLSYKQNNVTFYFSATSFLDERQVLYSYRLGNSNQWSEPSNNASVSFIDLPPGDYNLAIKAIFPAGRYSQQTINYEFSIASPWWQTGWFRTIIALSIIGVLILASRFYYSRKLEKQMAVLERQQAIEKERTRIATDMHDDLGAGLSRIKFLSETIGIKKQQHEPIEEDVNKIREYSHEMIDKMGEIVWALNEKNDSLSDLLSYTRAYTVEYLSQNGIDCKTEMPDSFPSVFVSGEFRRNIFLTIKEALHNVVKHSQATEVKLTININHHLSIKLKDNGTGFDQNNIRSFSNGLSNMESRLKEIGGKIEISNKQGTLVNLSIPLKA